MFTSASSIFSQLRTFPPSLRRAWNIVTDAVPANLIHVLPNSFRWFYRILLSRQITSYHLKANNGKKQSNRYPLFA